MDLAKAGKPPTDRKQTADAKLKKKQADKIKNGKSQSSYESKYTLIDISEEKMRSFMMS